MMGKRIRTFLLLLSLACFGYDFYLWGGLYATPGVGRRLMDEAPLDSPLAATYMFVGRKGLEFFHMQADAVEFAAKRFPEIVADPDSISHMAVHRVRAAQSASGSFAYLMAPAGLVLSWVLHIFRQKQIRSFGTRD